MDYYTFSYFMSDCISTDSQITRNKENGYEILKNPYIKNNKWDFQVDPQGIRYALNEIYDRYGIPIIVVENGLGAFDTIGEDDIIEDDYRIDYLRKHIMQMEEAVNDGVKLWGYTP